MHHTPLQMGTISKLKQTHNYDNTGLLRLRSANNFINACSLSDQSCLVAIPNIVVVYKIHPTGLLWL